MLKKAFFTPQGFYGVASKSVTGLYAVSAVLFLVGFYLAFFVCPIDATQGHSYRILFIHVASAWMSMLIYVMMAVFSAAALATQNRMCSVYAAAMAPTGALMAFLALFTGAFWGRPTWGAYWVWDARLTSELILLFLYLGFLALQSAVTDWKRADKACALIAIVGVVNVPIIYFSVKWWNTLHQGSTRMQQSIDPAMRSPLRWSIFGFLLLSATLTLMRMRNLILLMEKRRPWVSELILKRGRK